MKRFLWLFAALAVAFSANVGAAPTKKSNYFRLGSPDDAQNVATTAGTVLMGGGTDVDAAFVWLCGRATGGDFLVIRATGTDAYNPYVQQLCPGFNSVATLIIDSVAAANSASVQEKIATAEVIWIAGGDQSNYVNFWTGTPVQSLLNAHIAAGRPIGGTSAGLAVLTQFVYSALAPQGATSTQALANPFNKYMTFARDFVSIPAVAGTIGDTHFVTRDRMGRTLGFLCRINAAGWSAAPRAIAVDEETAVLIDAAGVGKVIGNSAAYFVTAPGAPETCQPRTPLTYLNVGVRKLVANQTFDVANWTGTAGSTYTVSATAGVLTSSQDGGSAY